MEFLKHLIKDIYISDWQVKVFLSIGILLLQWVIKFFLRKSLKKSQSSSTARYNWRKTSSNFIHLISLILLFFLWSNQLSSFATFLGLLTAGLAIAFKDPIMNLAGWYYVVFRKPFKLGDRIQVDDHTGDVVDISLFEFKLIEIGHWIQGDQSTGRILHLPNQKVFSSVIANYNALVNFIWDEISFTVAFESDFEKLKHDLEKILKDYSGIEYEQAEKRLAEISGEFFINQSKLKATVFYEIKENGILFHLRYLCDPLNRRNAKQNLNEKLLYYFKNNKDMRLNYTTIRVSDTFVEM